MNEKLTRTACQIKVLNLSYSRAERQLFTVGIRIFNGWKKFENKL